MLLLYTTLSVVGIYLDGITAYQNALPYGGAFLLSIRSNLLMAARYKSFIDKDMKQIDLCAKAGTSPASVTKMGRNGHVTTEILVKICSALDCGIEKIIEIIPNR